MVKTFLLPLKRCMASINKRLVLMPPAQDGETNSPFLPTSSSSVTSPTGCEVPELVHEKDAGRDQGEMDCGSLDAVSCLSWKEGEHLSKPAVPEGRACSHAHLAGKGEEKSSRRKCLWAGKKKGTGVRRWCGDVSHQHWLCRNPAATPGSQAAPAWGGHTHSPVVEGLGTHMETCRGAQRGAAVVDRAKITPRAPLQLSSPSLACLPVTCVRTPLSQHCRDEDTGPPGQRSAAQRVVLPKSLRGTKKQSACPTYASTTTSCLCNSTDRTGLQRAACPSRAHRLSLPQRSPPQSGGHKCSGFSCSLCLWGN
nr:uncharacterized protein LOC101803073 isoform X2 [Anas platyrhynchos]